MPYASSNAPLKGRKRFNADLKSVADLCVNGWVIEGLQAKDLRLGDDEGMILCEITHAASDLHIVTLNIIVPDTSEYPHSHSYFCCATNGGRVPPRVLSVVGSVVSERPAVIEDLLKWLLASFSARLSATSCSQSQRVDAYDENEMEQDEDSDVELYNHLDDDYYGLAV